MAAIGVKQRILIHLKLRSWVSGLELEMQSKEWTTKPSTISRRARELADDGAIDRMLFGRTVQYRIKKPISFAPPKVDQQEMNQEALL